MILAHVPPGDLVEETVHEEVGHAGAGLVIEGLPVLFRPHDFIPADFAELLQGPVPAHDLVVPVDDESRYGGSLENGLEALLAFLEGFLGEDGFRDVLKRFDGGEKTALGVPEHGSGDAEPFSALPEIGEKGRRLVGFVEKLRFLDFTVIPTGNASVFPSARRSAMHGLFFR